MSETICSTFWDDVNNKKKNYVAYTYPHPLTLSGPLQTCSQQGGSCCSGSQICQGGSFISSTDCGSLCCVGGGTCQANPCGNGSCDSGECSTCPQDCSLSQCCGRDGCNPQIGETCSSCLGDCPCTSGNCCSGSCITPACSQASDCGSNPCLTYTCTNPGTCSASCSSVPKTSCTNGDGCCPSGCTSQNDADCNLCTGLVLLHHYDNNPTYGESATKAYDFSGNGNNGTVSGATWNATGGKFAGAYEFDPSNSATINLSNPPSLNNLGPMTISMWIRPKQTAAYIISKRNGGGDWRIDIAATGSSGWYRGFSGTDPVVATNNGVITFNQLQHLVFAWDGNADVTAPAPAGAHYYINGVEPGYQSRTNGTGTKDNDASSLLFLASRAGTGVFFNGSIDELAIWNRSLSSQEIQSLYSSGSPISCQTCIHKSDNNPCDGKVCRIELFTFIDRWKYNNQDVNLRELIVAIGLWNSSGCP